MYFSRTKVYMTIIAKKECLNNFPIDVVYWQSINLRAYPLQNNHMKFKCGFGVCSNFTFSHVYSTCERNAKGYKLIMSFTYKPHVGSCGTHEINMCLQHLTCF